MIFLSKNGGGFKKVETVSFHQKRIDIIKSQLADLFRFFSGFKNTQKQGNQKIISQN